MIHQSHPRKDLIEIIHIFDVPIHNTDDYNKTELAKHIWVELCKMKDIKKENNYFFVEDIDDLKSYLRKVCPHQTFTKAVKDDLYIRTRNIIFYCRECSYSLAASSYDSTDQLMEDANAICKFGDNPTVRRALRLLRLDTIFGGPRHSTIPVPILTKRIAQRIHSIKELKKQNTPMLKVNKGEYFIEFS
jgi:hypothetical protein